MISSSYTKSIPVYYSYNSIQKETQVEKINTLKFLRELIEGEINFPLSKMKLVYNKSNILLNNENYKIYDFFGDVKSISLTIEPQEFTEESYIAEFAKAFNKEKENLNISSNQKTNVKENKNKYLKDEVKDKTYTTKIKEKALCNKDETNEATYICLKCRLYWCKHCIKFEVHKSDLVELSYIDTFLKTKRTNLSKELDESVCEDEYYSHLQKVDFILNEKISIIENQYKTMVELLNTIKESQMKSLIDAYYQRVDNKQFKSITSDIQYFKSKIMEVNSTYKKENIDENINNSEVLDKFKEIIKGNFTEFKIKYKDYFTHFANYEAFNTTFISQIEAKLKASNALRIDLIGENKSETKVSLSESLNNSSKSAGLLKIKYYNTVLQWDHTKNKMNRIKDFKDQVEFKLNYQVYSGNIFLNFKNKLLIVTGVSFNMCFLYDLDLNEMLKLPDLNDNHCRGSLISLKEGIICVSGKFTNKCEFIKYPNEKTIWADFPPLNYQRHSSSLFIYNDSSLYCFFGYNSLRGNIDIIEKISLGEDINKGWLIVNYANPKYLDCRLSSQGCVYANREEVYIVGGCIADKFSDKILKYNLVNNAIFPTEMNIPGLKDNEYFRFWEESEFKSLSSFGAVFNSDDDYTFGMFDAKDKLHLFNSRSYKYTINS